MVGTLIFINEGKIGETQIPDILAVKGQNKRRKEPSAMRLIS